MRARIDITDPLSSSGGDAIHADVVAWSPDEAVVRLDPTTRGVDDAARMRAA